MQRIRGGVQSRAQTGSDSESATAGKRIKASTQEARAMKRVSIQLCRHQGRFLRLGEHFKRFVYRIAKVASRFRAAPQMSSGGKFDGYPVVLGGHQNAGAQFDLDSAIHHPVGGRNIEIDERTPSGLL
jgi:hypothetical protein